MFFASLTLSAASVITGGLIEQIRRDGLTTSSGFFGDVTLGGPKHKGYARWVK